MLKLEAEDQQLPQGLRLAVEVLVAAKSREEGLGDTYYPRSIGSPPLYPWEFFRLCFPFADDFAEHLEGSFVADVPTARTLGCSWRWRAKGLSEAERRELIERLQRPPKSTGDAWYTWVRPLGLFVTHEGKNRVDFLRDCDVATIPAFVSTRDYPAASRLRIYEVPVCGRDEQWTVLDGRWVQRAPPLFHLAERVLSAYGVAQTTRWPSTFPNPARVCDAFLAHANVLCARGTPRGELVVDIQELREEDSEMICSVEGLARVWLRRRFWWLSLGAMVVCGLALTAFPKEWGGPRELAAACGGVGLGALSLVHLPMLRVRKRTLRYRDAPLPDHDQA